MEDKATVSQIAIRYGVIIGLVFIVMGMIFQFLNLDMETYQIVGNINYAFLAIGIVLAHKAFKEAGDGFMSLGQGLGIGTLISLIGGAMSGIFTYIYLKFIDDSMLEKIRDMQIEKMEEQGLDDDAIEKAMEITDKFMNAEMMPVWTIIGMLFFGFILSLIISLFTKKNNPTLEM